jgi:hypothetical protein
VLHGDAVEVDASVLDAQGDIGVQHPVRVGDEGFDAAFEGGQRIQPPGGRRRQQGAGGGDVGQRQVHALKARSRRAQGWRLRRPAGIRRRGHRDDGVDELHLLDAQRRRAGLESELLERRGGRRAACRVRLREAMRLTSSLACVECATATVGAHRGRNRGRRNRIDSR